MKITTLLFLSIVSISAFAQKRIIKTERAPQPIAPYSQAVEANGLIFVAGQVGLDPRNRQLVTSSFEAETTQVMENIKAILEAANLTMDDIINTTIYIKDIANFQKVNDLYGKYFKGDYPARTTIGVANLPASANIEIAVVAARPSKK
jgi:2-iminobutanoate/2-iminopropanoate deaminase